MSLIYKVLSIPHFAGPPCPGNGFLGLPPWYKYLSGTTTAGQCSPQLNGLSNIWLIVAAVIEILLRVAAVAAVAMIIYAGVQYATSQGSPDKTGKALSSIIAAAIGLAICILSAVVVTFIAESLK